MNTMYMYFFSQLQGLTYRPDIEHSNSELCTIHTFSVYTCGTEFTVLLCEESLKSPSIIITRQSIHLYVKTLTTNTGH